jgi:DNA polymerase/3'-5' exonuclease PolX
MDYTKADIIAKYFQLYIPDLFISGSLHRKEKIINDIDFITNTDLDILFNMIKENFNIKLLSKGQNYMSLILISSYGKIKIDIWKANNKYEYKFLKWMRNLDKGHNIYYRKEAKKKGLTLSDRGLKDNNQYYDFTSRKKLLDFIIN